MMKSEKIIWLMAVAVMMLTGCKDSDENVNNGNPVRVELAYTFAPSAAGNYTR